MKLILQVVCVFVFVAFSAVAGAAVAKLPDTFEICPEDSPQFDSCMETAIEKAIKELVKGYPPLGIYSVDPLRITSVVIDQGSGPVSVNLTFKDLDIHGLSTIKIKNFNDLNTGSKQEPLTPGWDDGTGVRGHVGACDKRRNNDIFTFQAAAPRLDLEGSYSVDGKVLVLPVKGYGPCKLGLDEMVADVVLTGERFKKDEITYIRSAKFDLKLETKKLSMDFANLFNNDKTLGDNMNKFLNENSQDIFKELKSAIEQTFGLALGEITNRIFTQIPYSDIFPTKTA